MTDLRFADGDGNRRKGDTGCSVSCEQLEVVAWRDCTLQCPIAWQKYTRSGVMDAGCAKASEAIQLHVVWHPMVQDILHLTLRQSEWCCSSNITPDATWRYLYCHGWNRGNSLLLLLLLHGQGKAGHDLEESCCEHVLGEEVFVGVCKVALVIAGSGSAHGMAVPQCQHWMHAMVASAALLVD